MIEWTLKNVKRIYELYDKYSDVLNQRYGYRIRDAKYAFLSDCQTEAEGQKRLSIDDYINELSARLGDAEELRRIKAECEKPHLEYYEEKTPLSTGGNAVYYRPVDIYVEKAKARVLDILNDIED